MLNPGLMKIRLDSASHKIKAPRDPETILKRVQDKVQGDRIGILTKPSKVRSSIFDIGA
jgi:hypothetical protein